jgi:hypothetical protein
MSTTPCATAAALARAGWFAPDALIIAEPSRGDPETLPLQLLAEGDRGAERLTIWRSAAASA